MVCCIHLNITIWKMVTSYYCMMCQSNAMTIHHLVDVCKRRWRRRRHRLRCHMISINQWNQSKRTHIVNKISDRHLFTLQKAHILPRRSILKRTRRHEKRKSKMTKWKIININSSFLQSACALFVSAVDGNGGMLVSVHGALISGGYVRVCELCIKSKRKKRDQNKIKKKNGQIYLFN